MNGLIPKKPNPGSAASARMCSQEGQRIPHRPILCSAAKRAVSSFWCPGVNGSPYAVQWKYIMCGTFASPPAANARTRAGEIGAPSGIRCRSRPSPGTLPSAHLSACQGLQNVRVANSDITIVMKSAWYSSATQKLVQKPANAARDARIREPSPRARRRSVSIVAKARNAIAAYCEWLANMCVYAR